MSKNTNTQKELANIYALAQTLNQLTIPNCSLQVSPEIAVRLRTVLSNVQNKLSFKKEYWYYNIFQRTAIDSLILFQKLEELDSTASTSEIESSLALLHTNIGLGLVVISSVLEKKELTFTKIDIDNINYSTTLINSLFSKLGYKNISSVVQFWQEKINKAIKRNDINSLYNFFYSNDIKVYNHIITEKDKELNIELEKLNKKHTSIQNHKFNQEIIEEIFRKRHESQKDIQRALTEFDYSRIKDICDNSLVYQKKARISKGLNLDYIKNQIEDDTGINQDKNEVLESYLLNLSFHEFNALLRKYDINEDEIENSTELQAKKSGIALLLKKGFSFIDMGSSIIDIIKEEFSIDKILSFLVGTVIDKFLEVKTLGLWTIGKLFYKLMTI